MEAVFAVALGVDASSHQNRNDNLSKSRFKHIFRDYKHLYNASRIARYLEASSIPGGFSSFSDYMGDEDVQKLLRKRLYGVEQKSLEFLTDDGRKKLVKFDTGMFD